MSGLLRRHVIFWVIKGRNRMNEGIRCKGGGPNRFFYLCWVVGRVKKSVTHFVWGKVTDLNNYADDTTIFSCGSDLDVVLESLERDA